MLYCRNDKFIAYHHETLKEEIIGNLTQKMMHAKSTTVSIHFVRWPNFPFALDSLSPDIKIKQKRKINPKV